jgi:DNA-nicking Smr family endonuclease
MLWYSIEEKGRAMDFGDILDQWDRHTGKSPGKKALPLRGLPEGADPVDQGTDPLSVWLRAKGVIDKDAELLDSALLSEKGERRRRLRAKKPDATLDLHGQTLEEARISLEGFFRLGRQQGFEKLLIIHGKGNHSGGAAALKRVVRDFIEHCAFAGESGRAAAAEGGSGATWVLLKDDQPALYY